MIIVLLACRPVRRDNFAEMRLGQEFVKIDGRYAIALPKAQTKNHRPYDGPLDECLTPCIDRYLDHYRPILLSGLINDRVWITQLRGPLSGDRLYQILRRRTQPAFGRWISPHLFRDCAMTSLGEEQPDLVWLGMPLLHHSDHRIAGKHYNHARDSVAVRQYQASISVLRRKGVARTRTG